MLSVVENLKSAGQDYEFYPTTDEIIISLHDRLKSDLSDYEYSILDCGAGHGKVLDRLEQLGQDDADRDRAMKVTSKYAIEKSEMLIGALSNDVYIVGTDFYQQTLIDKRVDVIYSNPPYSEFDQWSAKIIREANAGWVYLLIPSRWHNDSGVVSKQIAEAIKDRGVDYEVVDTFSFDSAEDRKARVSVDLVSINMKVNRHSGTGKVDPFDLWFDEMYGEFGKESVLSEYEKERKEKERISSDVENELVTGGDLITSLERLYQRDLAKLIKNYKAISELDYDVLSEMNVDFHGVKRSLELKISSLKDVYWDHLFSNMKEITGRLTTKSRKAVFESLTKPKNDHAYRDSKAGKNTHIDFSVSNARAIVLWIIKSANLYFDDQLIETYEGLIEKANVLLYKSNERVFTDNDWRFGEAPHDLDRFQLDFRLVLTGTRGFDSYYKNQLVDSTRDRINDLIAVANNLNFSCQQGAQDFEWSAGKKNAFTFFNPRSQKTETLLEVRVFKNGNIHIRGHVDFMKALNVEHGRLKGWVKNPKEAAYEMGVEEEVANKYFNSNYQALPEKMQLLALTRAA